MIGVTGAARRACSAWPARLIVVAIVWVVAAAPAPATAAAGRVVLLQSPGASPGVRRCMTLIRDELVAGGFEVVTVDPGPALDPVSMAKRMGEQKGAVATIGLLGDPEHGSAELWILDKVGGAPEVRRIAAPRENRERAAEVLAIRTIELLRASALKLLVEANRPKSADPAAPSSPSATAASTPPAGAALAGAPSSSASPDVRPEAAPAPAPAPETRAAPPAPVSEAPAAAPTIVRSSALLPEERERTVALETGVSLLASPGELAPAAVPVARLRFQFASEWAVRLTAAGLGTRPRVDTERGSAAIAQELALVELAARWRAGRSLQPLLTAGAGTLHVRSQAEGRFPYLGQDDARWSMLLAAGGGVLARLGSHLALALEGQVLLASPHPVVRFVELEAAKVARPAFWTTLTLVVHL